jgi:hypothetical protein
MKYLLPLMLILLIPLAQAEISESSLKSYLEGSYNFQNDDVETSSYIILSLDNFTEEEAQDFLNKGSTGCFSSGNCNIKETSLGALTLTKFSKLSSNKFINWLKKNEIPLNKNLYIQIVSSSEVECELQYEDSKDNFTVDNYIQKRISTNDKVVVVECDSIVTSMSLISKTESSTSANIQIIQQKTSIDKTTFNLENTCFGLDSCNLQDTAYASYSLDLLNQNTKSKTYLKQNLNNDPINIALTYKVTKDPSMIESLTDLQQDDGSFNSIIATAIAASALKEASYTDSYNSALAYLESKQAEAGNIGNKKESAAVAYWIFTTKNKVTSSSYSTYCGDDIIQKPNDNGIEEICEFNVDCEAGFSCTDNCECTQISETGCELDVDCPGGTCDLITNTCEYVSSSECTLNTDCEVDEICEAGSCQEQKIEIPNDECTDDLDCEEDEECFDGFCYPLYESSSLWWLWLLILIIALGAGGYLAYQKYGKTPPPSQQQSFTPPKEFTPSKQPQQPIQPQQSQQPRRENMDLKEKELDKSIEEAKDLIKNKDEY